jgi:hypothetical protein
MTRPADIDTLFRLPLAEYTAARNALAASLKAAGRAADAAAVRALPKPSLSAWTVNQLSWHHRTAFNRLMVAGTRLRNAHTSKLAGGRAGLRAASAAHATALGELNNRAAGVLQGAGHIPTPELTHRIATTLEALASLEPHSRGPAGHLTRDVDPSGFEALALLVPRQGTSPRGTGQSRVIPFRQRAARSRQKKGAAGSRHEDDATRQARRKAAATKFRATEHAVRAARKAAAQAETELRTAATHVKVAEKAKAVLEKQLEKVAADADAARQDARRIAAAAEEAAQAIEDAERLQTDARRALDALS